MKELVILVFISALTLRVYSLTCEPCYDEYGQSFCEKWGYDELTEKDCPNGVGKTVCGCCDLCLKGLNDRCGGIYGIFGKCGKGLECQKWIPKPHPFYPTGRPLPPQDIFFCRQVPVEDSEGPWSDTTE